VRGKIVFAANCFPKMVRDQKCNTEGKKEENRALKVEYQQKYEDKNEIDLKCNTYA